MMSKTDQTTPRSRAPRKGRVPLYEQVADKLRAEIAARHQPGDKMESGPKLALRLGVSVLTVREAINALTQEGLVERMRGSGTYVCRVPVKPVAILIGLTPDHLRHSYFFLHLVHQLEARLQEAGIPCRQYFAYPGGGHHSQPVANAMFLEDVDKGRLSVVMPVSQTPDASLLRLLKARHIRLINTSLVKTDYAGMTEAAAGWLLANGRRRIALLHWVDEASRARFEAVLQAAGVSPDPRWMRLCNLNGTQPDEPAAVMREIWAASQEKPDGLICLSDVVLDLAAPALVQLGVEVPRQLMIAVHANRASGIRYPFPVARMELDPNLYAQLLADIVKRQSNGNRVEAPVVHHRWVPESPADTAAQGEPAAAQASSDTRSLSSQ